MQKLTSIEEERRVHFGRSLSLSLSHSIKAEQRDKIGCCDDIFRDQLHCSMSLFTCYTLNVSMRRQVFFFFSLFFSISNRIFILSLIPQHFFFRFRDYVHTLSTGVTIKIQSYVFHISNVHYDVGHLHLIPHSIHNNVIVADVIWQK